MGLLQRDPNGGGQKVICFQVKNTSWKPLTRHIITNVKRDVTLYMDEWSGYNVVQRIYKHSVVNHGHGIYVENGGAYTNTIEAFWSNYCKRAINGTYNSIVEKRKGRYKSATPNISLEGMFTPCVKCRKLRHLRRLPSWPWEIWGE